MEVTSTAVEASLSAINKTLMQMRVILGRMAAGQDQMLVESKKMTSTLASIVEEQETIHSPSSLFSGVQVVGAGASLADAVVAHKVLATTSPVAMRT
jgi:CII-binding regulator of phage lambda lysogenization HflD